VQIACAAHHFQFALQLDDLVLQDTAVGLDLCFARTAQKAAGTAALPRSFQVGPAPHEAATLVFQMREFDLQRAFLGAGAVAEDFQDQPGAVHDLGLEFLLQIALLNRRQGMIDDHQLDLLDRDPVRQFRHFASAEQRRRTRLLQIDDLGVDDLEFDRLRQTNGLFKPRRRRALQTGALRSLASFAKLLRQDGHNDDRPRAGAAPGIVEFMAVIAENGLRLGPAIRQPISPDRPLRLRTSAPAGSA
jgi:hypothetical protein